VELFEINSTRNHHKLSLTSPKSPISNVGVAGFYFYFLIPKHL